MADYVLLPLVGKRGEGKYVKISPEDEFMLSPYNWRLHKRGYAVATMPHLPRNQRTVLMHHVLMDAVGVEMVVDHINRDRLDNRRENLRLVNRREHALNRSNVSPLVADPSDVDSPRPSVYYSTSKKKWIALLTQHGQTKRVGTFLSKEVAESSVLAAMKEVSR